jgi:predicted nucleic acid-binding Zn ribbon protein
MVGVREIIKKEREREKKEENLVFIIIYINEIKNKTKYDENIL